MRDRKKGVSIVKEIREKCDRCSSFLTEARTEMNQRFATTMFRRTYHELSCDFTEANPRGINLTSMSKEISKHWNSLSKENCITITAGSV